MAWHAVFTCLNGTDHMTDHALTTWLSCTDDVPQEAITKELCRHESRSTAGNNQGAEQAVMTWLSTL